MDIQSMPMNLNKQQAVLQKIRQKNSECIGAHMEMDGTLPTNKITLYISQQTSADLLQLWYNKNVRGEEISLSFE